MKRTRLISKLHVVQGGGLMAKTRGCHLNRRCRRWPRWEIGPSVSSNTVDQPLRRRPTHKRVIVAATTALRKTQPDKGPRKIEVHAEAHATMGYSEYFWESWLSYVMIADAAVLPTWSTQRCPATTMIVERRCAGERPVLSSPSSKRRVPVPPEPVRSFMGQASHHADNE